MAGDKTERYLVIGVVALMFVATAAALWFTSASPPGGPAQNQPPTARISPTNLAINQGDTVEFSGANSTDPEGRPLAYAWDFGDGSTASSAIISHKFEITGALRVRLEVTDDKGLKNSSATSVWVSLNQVIPYGTATWTRTPPSSTPSNVHFPLDPNASRATVHLELNTSTPSGTKAVVSVLDPNGAVIYENNTTLTFGATIKIPFDITLPASLLTVYGEWTLRVEALPVNSVQVTASVGYSGTVRVEYKPA